VYDVTSGAAFYGPDGGYGIFAGNDATLPLAKFKVDSTLVNQPANDLSAEEEKTLNEWIVK